jgi:hypothetical protein
MWAFVASGLMLVNIASAGPIFSGPALVNPADGSVVFNLLSGGDLSSLDELPGDASSFNIQVISNVWSFDTPPGSSGFLNLGGTLSLAGFNSGLTFSETIDLSDETGNVVFTTNNAGTVGLPFQEALAEHILANNGKIFGGIIQDPGTEDDWATYFASGGNLTNYLFIELTVNDTNQIPEPAAVLVWAGIGGLGLAAHRWRRRRQASAA